MTGQLTIASDAEYARAARDPAFRHQLLAGHLKLLLAELNRLRHGTPDRGRAKDIRAGVEMAVKLSAILQK